MLSPAPTSRSIQPHRRWGRRPALVAAVVAIAAAAVLGARGLESNAVPGQPPGATADAFDYAPGNVGVMPIGTPALLYHLPVLSGLAFPAADDGWAVGSLDGALAWHWAAGRWQRAPMPAVSPTSGLLAVTALGRDDVWAVGSRNTAVGKFPTLRPLTMHWDGSAWRVVTGPAAGVGELRAVSADGRDDVWAVGRREPVRTARVDKRPEWRPLVARWDGARWLALPFPIHGPGGLDHVVALAPDDVWVASDELGVQGRPLVAHWDGATWTRVRAPFGPRDPVLGFAATSATDAWAVGGYVKDDHTHTLAAHWNGASWAIVPTPDRSIDSDLTGVVAVSPNDVWALGEDARGGSIALGFAEHWNGERWSIAPGRQLGIWGGPSAIAASRDGAAWAVGSCYFDNMLTRWDGRRFVVARHPPDRYWPANLPRRFRLGGPSCTSR